MKKFFIIIIASLFLTACHNKDNNQLNIYIGKNIVPENIFKGINDIGIKLNYNSYVSDEELYSNVRFINDGKYDLIMPSNDILTQLRKKNIISPVDISKLKNIDNIINSFFAQPYKTAKQFNIPYFAGSIGILINTKCANENDFIKWEDLWNNSYNGKIVMYNSMRDIFSITLKSIGYSINTMVEEEIKEAYDKLRKLYPKIVIKNYSDIKASLLNNESCIGILRTDDAYIMTKNNPDFKFILPKEGSLLWTESFAVLKTAKNIESVYKFIDYMIEPSNAAQVAEYSGVIPLINYHIIKPYLSNSMQKQYELFFSDINMQKMEVLHNIGPAMQIYTKYWNMLTKE